MDELRLPMLLEKMPSSLHSLVTGPTVLATLRSRYEAGRAEWPSLEVSTLEWLTQLVPHLKTREAISTLGQLSPDFYFAVALARGDRQALCLYAERYRPVLEAALRRRGTPSFDIDAVIAALEARLFVEGGRIAGYAGRGSLARFLRVTALNQLIDETRSRGQTTPLDEKSEAGLLGVASGVSPELEVLSRNSGAVFTAALRVAISRLEPRQRVVLRMHTLERATIDDIGAIYRVHRVTAFRWIETARAELRAHTEAALKGDFSLGSLEVVSFIRELPSRLELNLESMLAS